MRKVPNLISVFCIISWRIFWLTMLNRTCPDAEPKMVLTPAELDLLNCLVKDSKRSREQLPLSHYLEKLRNFGSTSHAPTTPHQEISSCGEACVALRICSLASISLPKDMGNRKLGPTLACHPRPAL